jgi:hypothetical protein
VLLGCQQHWSRLWTIASSTTCSALMLQLVACGRGTLVRDPRSRVGCEGDLPVATAFREGWMAAQHLGNGKDRAGRAAGTGPTYPPPQPHGLSPVLERNIRALQLRRQREEKEATAEERVASIEAPVSANPVQHQRNIVWASRLRPN